MQAAKEAVLKEDLHVMRNAIDSYTMDKEKAPQSLDDLVQAGYLKSIPTDPMTHSDRDLGDEHRRHLRKRRPERAGNQRCPQRLAGSRLERPDVLHLVRTRRPATRASRLLFMPYWSLPLVADWLC